MAVNTPKALINVEGKVKSHNAVSKDKPQSVVKQAFALALDFSKCTPAEIMDLAKDGIIVKLQSRARTMFFAKENMGKDGKTPVKSFASIIRDNMSGTIDVKAAIVEKARTPGKSLLTKTSEMLAKLSVEERKAMLATLSNIK